jgi:hypothetical protein
MPITPLGCVRLGESHDAKMQSIQFTTSKNRGTRIKSCAIAAAWWHKQNNCILLAKILNYFKIVWKNIWKIIMEIVKRRKFIHVCLKLKSLLGLLCAFCKNSFFLFQNKYPKYNKVKTLSATVKNFKFYVFYWTYKQLYLTQICINQDPFV